MVLNREGNVFFECIHTLPTVFAAMVVAGNLLRKTLNLGSRCNPVQFSCITCWSALLQTTITGEFPA